MRTCGLERAGGHTSDPEAAAARSQVAEGLSAQVTASGCSGTATQMSLLSGGAAHLAEGEVCTGRRV